MTRPPGGGPCRGPTPASALLPFLLAVLLAVLPGVALPARAQSPSGAAPAESDPDVIVVEGGEQVVRPAEEADAPPPFFSGPEQAGARTVIPRAAFKDTQKTVADVLEEAPGVTVTRSGDGLGATRVSIRGSRPEQVLILVDGVPLAAPGDHPSTRRAESRSGVDLAALPLEDVESIEIVRGAATSLYGPGAAAGAVVIHLRRRNEPALSLAGTVGDGYQEADAAWSRPLGAEDDANRPVVGVHLNHRDSNGRYVYYDPNTDAYLERDYNATRATNLALDWRSGARLHVGLTLEALRRDGLGGVAAPQPYGRQTERRVRLVYDDGQAPDPEAPRALRLSWNAHAQWLGGERVENTTLPSSNRADYSDRRGGGELRGEQWLGDQRLEAGVALSGEVLHHDEFVDGRTTISSFGGWSLHAREGTLEASLRWDDLSGLAPATTGRAAASWRLAGPVGVKASHARGYRPPSLDELYAPGATATATLANPDLVPERSVSTDGGLYAAWGETAYLELLAFRQDTRGQILAVPVGGGGSELRFENLERTRTTGWEAAANLRLGGFTADANATRQDARILEAEDPRDNGHVVPGVPDVRASLSVAWRIAGWHLWGRVAHSGRRFVAPSNVAYLRPYTLLDAGFTWRLGRGFSVALEGRNLTAVTYAELDNFPAPGRQYFLTLRWEQGKKNAERSSGDPSARGGEPGAAPIPGRDPPSREPTGP